ncbi:type I methionyl aminopeptidase [Candidatus Woesebacteria bacterium]|nr:type I methionyl aminopeptidase [Candidatus Woesebacteria bacterium]
MSGTIKPKNKTDQKKMIESGKRLSYVKNRLKEAVKIGVSAKQIEDLAVKLIKKEEGKASFKMVPNYDWATCINVNEGIVHGIPKKEIVFQKGDVVSVDVGIYYDGFHTDTSFTLGLEVDEKTEKFLEIGEKTLNSAIEKAKPGNRIYDISKSIEDMLKKSGYTPIKALVGHGIGRQLHEEPQIPCYTSGEYKDSPVIPDGACMAIEVMYSFGSEKLVLDEDGWTIVTSDGKISALFEDTVIAAKGGTRVLTA